jgi:cytochrome c oxidase cbb3-type subunit III
MRRVRDRLKILFLIASAFALFACEREHRRIGEAPPPAADTDNVQQSGLQPGQAQPQAAVENTYEKNAYAVSEGKRLFQWYNCSGCHAQGGGGMGPPLMDAEWIYGSDPQNIYSTIVEGRPNGMPSFRDKIGSQEIWELVAYVRSLSGLLPKDISGGRDDHMSAKPSEQSMPSQKPAPKQAERAQ